jgi:hypothetical protein
MNIRTAVIGGLGLLGSSWTYAGLTYNKDVRPILSDKCFFCHGPDAANQKAGLRLDSAATAFAALKESDGHAIMPGDLAKSVAWQRIEDSDDPMPPISAKNPLTESEKNILRSWILQGATYETHWAFIPLPAEVPLPEVAEGKILHPIDRFVQKRLSEEKITPAAPTEPLRWLRRATLDLTGLPPTLEQIAAFEAAVLQNPETAYASAVDGLLATKAYGEHMATPWLDAARYADTFGYHSDSDFTPWPYRDWVVRAFNNDLSYRDFLTYQLAGDLLPGATQEQKLATTFNRLHRITNEGGSVWEEFFVDGVADRVNTLGTSILGLTLECSKCHDHKYDPITQQDYYGLFAFFNSINETGVYNHSSICPPPSLQIPTVEQAKAVAEKTTEVKKWEATLAEVAATADARFALWKSQAAKATPIPDEIGRFDFEETNHPLLNRISGPKAYTAEFKTPKYTEGKNGTAALLDGDTGVLFPNFFLKDRWNAFTVAGWFKDTERSPKPVNMITRCYGHDVGYNGFHVLLENGYLETRIFRSWPDVGIGVCSVAQFPKNTWGHFTLSYDGSGRASGIHMYLNGEELQTNITADSLEKQAAKSTIREGHFAIGWIFRGTGFKGGSVDDLRLFERALSGLEIREIAEGPKIVNSEDERALRAYYLSAIDETYRRVLGELESAREALIRAQEPIIEVPVMREMPEPRQAYVLARGAYDAPKTEDKKIGRATIASLIPFPAGAPRNRLGLAQWLTEPDHPLTARVFVNRVWAQFFGRGIVATLDNFGLQGELPSHPELLNWLARDFVQHNWSIKHLCRQIVLSGTYRQRSGGDKALSEADPDNRLLARGPAHRLPAETIRDLALAASGLLDSKEGGSPVRPYDPKNNVKPELSQVHSRSLYSYWRRTRPIPSMIALDRPSLEVCSVKRNRTNSPQQALVLLNDVQYVEAARHLAGTVMQQAQTLDKRLQLAWNRLVGTPSLPEEQELLRALYAEQFAVFSKSPTEADKLLKIGLKAFPAQLNKPEAAALTVVCQAILNSDATIWKR